MRKTFAVIAAIALASTGARAQDIDALKMSLNDSRLVPRDAAAIGFVSRLGKCLAVRAKANILAFEPRSAKSNSGLIELTLSDVGCGSFRDNTRYSSIYLRGPIAEAYLGRLGAQKKMTKSELRIYAEPSAEQLKNMPSDVRTDVVLVSMGACVDKADHSGTLRIFDTEVGSHDETEAFRTITPALSGCVPPGVQLSFSKFELRGYLAEGAFRNAVQSMSAGRS
ncbi:MAG: hypothetical protein JSR28_08280 [Proteobacteria bacterium]|nr:hypothetical protein [Pseudomonadota bacterium]